MANFLQKILRRASHAKSTKVVSLFENWEKIRDEGSRRFTIDTSTDKLTVEEVQKQEERLDFTDQGCALKLTRIADPKMEYTQLWAGIELVYNSKSNGKSYKAILNASYHDEIRVDVYEPYMTYNHLGSQPLLDTLRADLELLGQYTTLRLLRALVQAKADNFSNLVDYFTDEKVDSIVAQFVTPVELDYYSD